MEQLGPRMSHPSSQLWVYCNDCFAILQNEREQERHGNYLNAFSERNLIQSNLVILEQKSYGVFFALNLLSGCLYSVYSIKGTKRYMKILLVVF